jgi:hypothetical protein
MGSRPISPDLAVMLYPHVSPLNINCIGTVSPYIKTNCGMGYLPYVFCGFQLWISIGFLVPIRSTFLSVLDLPEIYGSCVLVLGTPFFY